MSVNIQVDDISLAPAQAELRITVTLDRDWGDAEVRGRLMGPRCVFSRTVEIAYPLRPVPGSAPDPRSRSYRVIIPEASLWDLQSPFLYAGPVELWLDGLKLDEVWVSHGLRALSWGPHGVRLNGRPVAVLGREIESGTAEDLAAWRTGGINLLVAPVNSEKEEVWSLADQQGFLVLGRVLDATSATRQLVLRLGEHASSLGWLPAVPGDFAWIGKGAVLPPDFHSQ